MAGSASIAHPAEVQSQPTGTVQWDPKKSWNHMAAGAVGGMTGGLITAPLDVVKTRLQSSLFAKHPEAHAKKGVSIPYSATMASSSTAPRVAASGALPAGLQSALGTTQASAAVAGKQRNILWNFVETAQLLRDIARTEGITALWRGIGPTLVGAIPARSIQFFTYGNMKLIIAEKFNGGREASWVHLLAAANAGVATGIATNPIWVVKTRLQLSSGVRKAAAEAHTRAASVKAPAGALVDGALKTGPAAVSSGQFTQAATAIHSPKIISAVSPFQPAGTVGAAPTSMSTNALRPPSGANAPPKPPFTNAFNCTTYIIRNEGIRGLYKGLSASMLGVSELVIQWVVYERFKRMGISEKGGKLGEWTGVLGAAGGAKLLAALITYPHEVLRTRLRQPIPAGALVPKYRSLVQTFKLVLAEEGARALYSGLTAHMMRVVPNAAAMYSVYELALRL